jgi:phosphohistidine phosphatase
MPKTLLILRHAEAYPGGRGGDKTRDLTEEGRITAAQIGRALAGLEKRPDLIVTSDATRAMQTAEIVAKEAAYGGEIRPEPDMYGAWLDALLETMRRLPDDAECVLMVGHNPGLTDLCAALRREGPDEYIALRTASLAHFELDAPSWRRVREKTGTLVAVYTPGDWHSRY